jgi:outer membrane protein assembly factor BamB
MDKNIFKKRLIVFVALFSSVGLTFAPAGLRAQDWPQWRGPSSNGISVESAELPTRWGVEENIAWKTPIAGLGTSSPIVWGNQIIVTSQVGDIPGGRRSQPKLARDDPSLAQLENPIGGQSEAEPVLEEISLVVEAFNRANGKRLWVYQARAAGEFPRLHEKHNLATPTPVTDGELIYAWFGNGQILALDLEGKLVWTRHLGLDYGSFLNQWGHGSSPVVYKDLLILLCDHKTNAYLLALDKKTGEESWKLDRGSDGRVAHSTPVVIPGPDGDELIVNSSELVESFNPVDGKLKWYAGSQRQTPIPTPVFHEGVIYMARGYRNSDVLAIRPGGRGDVSSTHILWRSPSGASYVPSILYYQGLLYMTNEVGVVTCADADTGKRVWRERLGGIFFASPVAGDGKVYMISETGETFVLQAGREPQVLARNNLEERFIASPAISSGHLILRSDRTLFSIGK